MNQKIKLIGHNGPHDIRCIDHFLGYETDVVCAGETYIPSHHADSRNKQEGGIGHGLKELAIAHIDRNAGKWEQELKKVFKTITVPMPGEFYKSGPKKGLPKERKARLSEGWSLIDPTHPAYVAYAAADPILTWRVWEYFQPVVEEFIDLYRKDHRVQIAVDRLQRRAIKLDVDYTIRLSNAYTAKAEVMQTVAAGYGCENIQSGQQLSDVLLGLEAELTERTATDKYKTDARVLRGLFDNPASDPVVRDFIHSVLVAKQVLKRREAYTDAMLREMDENERVHPSINALAARTARMSISGPALQQLPTKDHESETMWETEDGTTADKHSIT